MTKEEAKKILYVYCAANLVDASHREAFDMAIKALEQEPCEDCISRAEVMENYNGVETPVGYRKVVDMEVIKNMQSVYPKAKVGHWIEKAEDYYKAINDYGGGVDENTDYFTDDIACSECLAKYSVIDNETEFFKCCPNCGAKMVEPQESEDKI